MEIYLVRHGIAASRPAEGSMSDEERPLTPKGIKRTSQAAKGLLTLKPSIDEILTSPLLRACQTATILAKALELENRVAQIEELAPEGDHNALLTRLASYQESQGVLLVGHQPSIGEIASLLLAGNNRLQFNFKKCAICCIEFDAVPAAGQGALNWMLAPKHLRKLARHS
jgi:phosphohistidine phosphatase